LIVEILSPKSTLESHVNLQGKMCHLSLDSITILQHSSHDFDDIIGEGLESSFSQCFPPTIIYHFSSHRVGYVKCGLGETFLDIEALRFQLMVMSGSHCLSSTLGLNNTTHNENRSQGTLQVNFIYGSHYICHSFSISFQQSYVNHCNFYDGIESWLEESYMSTFTMNNNAAKFNMLGKYFLESILPTFDPSQLHFLQSTFDENVVACLELLDWIH
jgi:hypothetical protein